MQSISIEKTKNTSDQHKKKKPKKKMRGKKKSTFCERVKK